MDIEKELELKAKCWDLLIDSIVDIIDDVHKENTGDEISWGNLQQLIR